MNVHEAAMLAWLQGARLAVPFHYGLWRDAITAKAQRLTRASSSPPIAN